MVVRKLKVAFTLYLKERSSWVCDISTTVRLVSQSLFPPFRILPLPQNSSLMASFGVCQIKLGQ